MYMCVYVCYIRIYIYIYVYVSTNSLSMTDPVGFFNVSNATCGLYRNLWSSKQTYGSLPCDSVPDPGGIAWALVCHRQEVHALELQVLAQAVASAAQAPEPPRLPRIAGVDR